MRCQIKDSPMLLRQTRQKLLWKCAAGLCAVGTLFGATCSSDQIQAIATGLQAAASEMDDRDDNITFGDWLLDELEDL